VPLTTLRIDRLRPAGHYLFGETVGGNIASPAQYDDQRVRGRELPAPRRRQDFGKLTNMVGSAESLFPEDKNSAPAIARASS